MAGRRVALHDLRKVMDVKVCQLCGENFPDGRVPFRLYYSAWIWTNPAAGQGRNDSASFLGACCARCVRATGADASKSNTLRWTAKAKFLEMAKNRRTRL